MVKEITINYINQKLKLENKMSKITIEELSTFCKKKGFVYQSSEIYGGISGFFDMGPLGVELFNNLKQNWWKHFVQDKENMTGIDASIISHPRIWKASGHLDSFGDFRPKAEFISENVSLAGWESLPEEERTVGLKKNVADKFDILFHTYDKEGNISSGGKMVVQSDPVSSSSNGYGVNRQGFSPGESGAGAELRYKLEKDGFLRFRLENDRTIVGFERRKEF